MSACIGILDYGMGNMSSVSNALDYLGYDWQRLESASAIQTCSHLIIPGVGSYATAMQNIKPMQAAILEHAQAGKPLLGICLGMQLLAELGNEDGPSEGLGFIAGRVEVLDLAKQELPVPHVGWNALHFNADHPICENLKRHVDFYFVHSYFFNVSDEAMVLAYTDYGKRFPAIVASQNLVGIQFHPEKSQENGLLLLENFCEWDGVC